MHHNLAKTEITPLELMARGSHFSKDLAEYQCQGFCQSLIGGHDAKQATGDALLLSHI